MKQAVLLWFFLFLWLCSSSEAQQRTLDPKEAKALEEIGKKLNVKSWNFSSDPCSNTGEWQQKFDDGASNNVTCGNCSATNQCHIISIHLKSLNLTGVIPEEFANLTYLTEIDLTRNYIRGTIPAALDSLPLEILSVIVNRLWGPIPDEIGNIKTLKELVLEGNILEGPLPSSLGKLSNLNRLLLSGNRFTGELPESLGELSNLQDIRLDGNAFSGSIPKFFENLTSLKRFDMQGTSLKGPFPPNFSNLKALNQLTVSDADIGVFPSLGNMNMQYLTLRNCNLSGELPKSLGEMTLKKIDLSYNNFSGEIPSNYENLVDYVNNIYLTNNMLSGSIPSWMTTSKQNMDLSFNSFNESGSGLTCGAGNVDLASSYVSSEHNLNTCLRRNLPCAVKPMNYKLFINCGGQRVKYKDDEYEQDAQPLGTSNYYSTQNWAFSSTGDYLGSSTAPYITTNVSTLSSTTKNPILYMSARLTAVSLTYYGFCLQTGNYTVKLHFAEIMFTDDETYASNGRRIFDASIQGNKVLTDFNISKEANGTGKGITKSFFAIVDENSGSTLQINFQWHGKGTNSAPERGVYGPLISAISVTPNFPPELENSKKKKLSGGAITGIVIAAFVLLVSIVVILFLYIRKKNQEDKDRRAFEMYTGYFSLKQIKSATKNFSQENKIGEGGFGPVYKGVLPPDGLLIAVKILSSKSKQGNREFVNEIGMISASQHPNLVKLLGCCVEGNQLILVYEYMENNSLARALFGPEGVKMNLDWATRRKICIGIAKGLNYLHEESAIKIVHRDIKATNVLLDKNLDAKISDFGLAKLDIDEGSHISTRIAGTAGYIAPEYALRGYLTDKADVYSFGIVLLELVSGMSNTNYRPKDEFVYLLDWAYVLKESDNMLELVDPCLESNYSKKEALDMLNLALLCASPSPTLRPKMSSIINMLEGHAPLALASIKHLTRTPSEALRFKAFENISNDSLTSMGMTDTSWSISNTNKQGTTTKQDVDDSTKSEEMNLLD